VACRSAEDELHGAASASAVSRHWPSAIAFGAGAATVAAFEPAGAFPLALLTYAVLIHLWVDAPPAARLPDRMGVRLGLFGAGVSWVHVGPYEFGGMPAPLAVLATLVFCGFLALFPASTG